LLSRFAGPRIPARISPRSSAAAQVSLMQWDLIFKKPRLISRNSLLQIIFFLLVKHGLRSLPAPFN
jgi:hypothetical protein